MNVLYNTFAGCQWKWLKKNHNEVLEPLWTTEGIFPTNLADIVEH